MNSLQFLDAQRSHCLSRFSVVSSATFSVGKGKIFDVNQIFLIVCMWRLRSVKSNEGCIQHSPSKVRLYLAVSLAATQEWVQPRFGQTRLDSSSSCCTTVGWAVGTGEWNFLSSQGAWHFLGQVALLFLPMQNLEVPAWLLKPFSATAA